MPKTGNEFLYLLSDKKQLTYSKFKQYISSYDFYHYNLLRDFSAMGYLDIDNSKRTIVVRAIPPMLIELPFTKKTYLLSGARSPQLRQVVNEVARIKTQDHMPETIIIDAKHTDKLLAKTLYGKRVQDYVRISFRPLAWCLLESANDLQSYEHSTLSWVAGDREHIKRIFSVEELNFCPCTKENYRGTILAEIKHHDSFSRYYLFNTKNEEMAKINLDQGRFFVLKQAGRQVLKYDRRKMQLRTEVYLPNHLERALVLCRGGQPLRKGTVALFDRISLDVAEYVATKLQQSLQFGDINV